MSQETSCKKELSELFTRMFNEDTNKCYPGTDFKIDLQGYVTSTRTVGGDYAQRNFFSFVDKRILQRDTYKAFIALLDNYEMELGKAERVTDVEQREIDHFLDLIMEKKAMRDAHQYLVSKGRAPENPFEFKKKLYDIWFRLISRTSGKGVYDSCSFEHVFVGETRGRRIVGLHNWVQFYLQEKKGKIDYKGYFRRETVLCDSFPRLVTLQFTWKGDMEKPIGTIFLGSSPEFEIAIFTVLRMLNIAKDTFKLGEYETEITCYPLGEGVGTAYIGIEKEDKGKDNK